MGYNQDKEALPQINLCMLMGEKSGLPIYQTAYSGSLKDVSTLKTTLAKMDALSKGKPMLNVYEKGGRTIVEINCRLDSYYIDEPDDDYDDCDSEDCEEDEEKTGSSFVADNELLNLLVKIREQLIQGDYRSLYTVWEKYGDLTEEDEEDDEDEYESIIPPKPPERSHGKNIIEQFSNMLE